MNDPYFHLTKQRPCDSLGTPVSGGAGERAKDSIQCTLENFFFLDFFFGFFFFGTGSLDTLNRKASEWAEDQSYENLLWHDETIHWRMAV